MRSLLVLGALTVAGCQKVESAHQTKALDPVGRFVIVSSREQRGDYLLDTVTGKVWASYRLSDHGDRLVWVYATRLDDKAHVKNLVDELNKTKVADRKK